LNTVLQTALIFEELSSMVESLDPCINHCFANLPKSRMCFSSLSFSSCDEMLARCMPWYRQYCVALNQFACNGKTHMELDGIELNLRCMAS